MTGLRPSDLAPLARRVASSVARAIVRRVVDATAWQEVQLEITRGDVDDYERVQDYGITSHPHPGAEAIVVEVGGSADHLVAIRVDDRRYRVRALAEGEVCLYDDLGQEVRLTRTGIVVSAPLVKVGTSGGSHVGAVHGLGVDPYTGQTYSALGSASSTVKVTP